MIAYAMLALLLAVEPAQEAIENLEDQTVQVLQEDESNCEEVVLNEECEELTDEIVFGDETEASDELISSEEEI